MRITLKCVTESRRNPNHLDKIQKETRPIAKPILITNYEKKMNTFGTNLFRIELYFTLANFLKHPTISVLTTVLLQTKVTILNAELVSTQIFFFTLDKIVCIIFKYHCKLKSIDALWSRDWFHQKTPTQPLKCRSHHSGHQLAFSFLVYTLFLNRHDAIWHKRGT